MGYWKSKILPKIHKVLGKDGAKRTDAAEACKSFDESKEEISKEFEEKKGELQPKVIEVYQASSTEIKTLVKEPAEIGLKKHSVEVQKFLNELVKIEFPGSRKASEAASKCGPALVPGPVLFIFEKVSTLVVVTEEKSREVEVPPSEIATTTKGTSNKEKEIIVEEETTKKEVTVEAEKPGEPMAETTVAKEELPKIDEQPKEPPQA